MQTQFPLAPMQEGMLFHHLTNAGGGADVEQAVIHFNEAVDENSLRLAWNRVSARRDALRASFDWTSSGAPFQSISPQSEVSWRSLDFSALPEDEQERRFQAFLREDRALGFALNQPPLSRLCLFQIAPACFRLVWTFHHILLDGRSIVIILKEVLRTYDALLAGDALELPPPIPYQNYILWLRSQDHERSETFWRNLLRGKYHPTPLLPDAVPASQPRSPDARGQFSAQLDAAATASLSDAARGSSLTFNTFFQGAWALLLGRYSGDEDPIFGAARSCRHCPDLDTRDIAGLLFNTVPVHARLNPKSTLRQFLIDLRQQHLDARPHERAPLHRVQQWSEMPPGSSLFHSMLIYEHADLNAALNNSLNPSQSSAPRRFELIEQTIYPLTAYACGGPQLLLKLAFDTSRFQPETARRMLDHLLALLRGFSRGLDQPLEQINLLTEQEKQTLLFDWNATELRLPQHQAAHQLFEAQASANTHPRNSRPAADEPEPVDDPAAVVFRDAQVSHGELNARANRLARYLRARGAGPEVLVALCLDRSIDLVVALLAILKTGAAYVPLDPEYPKERLDFMLQDSNAALLVTQSKLASKIANPPGAIIRLDSEAAAIALESPLNLDLPVHPDSLAYVIYTSGSTGKPKGVMITHRNLQNFFAAMDQVLGADPPGVWLAVTSVCFDISVLELLWTLARGYKVVLYSQEDAAPPRPPKRPRSTSQNPSLEFSLFYFSADAGEDPSDKFSLLLDGARFADQHGFSAVWTPERHFHGFGGLYPNPAVAGAALAAITQRIQIRAGSVVLPLHSPIRVAEDWSVVDNLSRGRAGLSVASGWMPEDFVIQPAHYEQRKTLLFRNLEIVRKLWRGERIAFPGPLGEMVEIQTLPRPIQPELPVWITTAGNPETYKMAGEAGANLLTHLLGQTLDEVAEKIALYRDAWQKSGRTAPSGRVTLMLHTFVGDCAESVKKIVQKPLKDYLRSSVSLIRKYAWSFPAFPSKSENKEDAGFENLTPEELDALLQHAADRYIESSGLIGTQDSCLDMLERIQAAGVDEVACLIDFGIPKDRVLSHLPHLHRLKEAFHKPSPVRDFSIPALLQRHAVTHFQCTPSQASLLLLDDHGRASLRNLRKCLIGGEAFPSALAQQLRDAVSGEVLNMYGPTETTVWSACYPLGDGGFQTSVPIGRPLANTEIYLLGPGLQPVPVGVPAELYIGGAGVARGYWRRPSLTEERFVPHPFRPHSPARLYRTGDIARYLPDGRIEFLGRADHQVKIRGHRIELGEIEAQLLQHPSIRETVVLAREDSPGNPSLAAYYVRKEHPACAPAELRLFLKDRLPSPMIPAHFIPLPAFPLTPNGKINRNALPRPQECSPDRKPASESPETSLEQLIARIWTEVLQVPAVSRNDNFFDMGGHSLSAVQVHARLKKSIQKEILLTDLFRFPTVRTLGEYLTSEETEESAPQAGSGRAEMRKQLLQKRRFSRSR